MRFPIPAAALICAAPVVSAAPDGAASAKAVADLKAALASGVSPAEAVGAAFAATALTKEDSDKAAGLLWDAHVAGLRDRAKADLTSKTVSGGGKTMKFGMLAFGPEKAPEGGRSLFISMHGGGNAPAPVNDSQWKNQIALGKAYKPSEGLYVAPRAPTDTWNLWHEPHIDACFDRLIADLVILGEVNPDRVYLMGYSAGGDGVYQLAPRMSDRWAAAAMMAGHPNETIPAGFRNVPTAFQVGERDGAYDRNKICAEWGVKLDALRKADPKGYEHLVDLPAGKPHWMGLEDRKAVPWMEKFTRNTRPDRIVWVQDDVTHTESYWLGVPAAEAKAGVMIVATRDGSQFDLETKNAGTVLLRLDDRMTDLDAPVEIGRDGVKRMVRVTRTIGTLAKTLASRGDRKLMFPAEAVSPAK